MPSVVERFWSKVERREPEECWEWQGSRYPSGGHGKFHVARKGMRAHRFSAMLHFGMFDTRLQVLHHCDNAACVNPAHLYLGNHDDNMRDMRVRGRGRGSNSGKTHCVHGHEFTPENTRTRSNGWRICKRCDVRQSTEYKQRRRILDVLGSGQ